MYDFWDSRKVAWYIEALEESSFGEETAKAIAGVAPAGSSIIDMGCGVGALTLPLARAGYRVVASDPSFTALRSLKAQVAEEGLSARVRLAVSQWEETAFTPQDYFLMANVPFALDKVERFLSQAHSLSRRGAMIFRSRYEGEEHRFFFNDLYPLLLGKPWDAQRDENEFTDSLAAAGLEARITLVHFNFDQSFQSLEEAVDFWCCYLKLEDLTKIPLLREYLEARLERCGGRYIRRIPKTGELISWNW